MMSEVNAYYFETRSDSLYSLLFHNMHPQRLPEAK